MSIDLSKDQQYAFDLIFKAVQAGERELVLSGPAGSGKTSLVRFIIEKLEEQGRRVVLMAPTGKAAARLTEVTGRQTNTVHSLLYGQVFEDGDGKIAFARPRSVVRGDTSSSTVVICDEASMLGRHIHEEILRWLPDGVALLCVGDREQLKPVMDTWGPDFDNPTACLTEIHRQAEGSPIIQLATAIRKGQPWRSIRPDGKHYQRVSVVPGLGADRAADWLARVRLARASGTLITYTNRTRKSANDLVRQKLEWKTSLSVGDTLVCTKNCHWAGIMNGETLCVSGYEVVHCYGEDDEPSNLVRLNVSRNVRPFTAPSLLGGADGGEWDEAEIGTNVDNKHVMRAEYGECLTCHKSQGSEWTNVGIIIDYAFEHSMSEADFRRTLYTAVTRAKKKVVIFVG